MNRPMALHAVPATGPFTRRPLPLLATSAPISHFGPPCFQSLAHSSAIRWGWGVPHPTAEPTPTMSSRAKRGICFFCTSDSLSLSKSTLTEKHRVSPGFDRNRPCATSLESIFTRIPIYNLFRCNTYRKQGGGGIPLKQHATSDFQRLPYVPLPPPPPGATMAGNRETSPLTRCLTY